LGNLKHIMTNLYIELLEKTSKDNITFLKDVKPHIILNKRGKFKYFWIPYFEIKGIKDFLSTLEDQSLYTVIPSISLFGKDEDPHLILSKQILITSYSKPEIINKFLIKQLDRAFIDFEFNLENKFYYLIFKFKKIHIQI
jgi:hypothetical protein